MASLAIAGLASTGTTNAAGVWIPTLAPGVGIILGVGAALFDALVLMPALAGKKKQQRPKTLFSVPQDLYQAGQPRIQAMGRRILVPTHTMFASTRIQEATSRAGKGGPQVRTSARQVFYDIGFALNDGPTNRLVQLLINKTAIIASDLSVVGVTSANWSAIANSSISINVAMDSIYEADLSLRFVPIIKDGGVATGTQSATTLKDTSKTWTVDQHKGRGVRLISGTGAGQWATILGNTVDTLTIGTAYVASSLHWTTTPVSASTGYQIEGKGDHVKLSGWGSGQDGFWFVYSVTRHQSGSPSHMTLVPRAGQTPTVTLIRGGNSLNPARIDRVEGAVIDDAGLVAFKPTGGSLRVASAQTDLTEKFRVGDIVMLNGWTLSSSPVFPSPFQVARISTQDPSWPSPLNPTAGLSGSVMTLEPVGWALSGSNVTYESGTYLNAATIEQNVQDRSGAFYMRGWNFHAGTDTQTEDSIIAQHQPTGHIPGFRHLTYIVLDEFNGTEFGNVPPSAEALLEVDSSFSVAQALQRTYARAIGVRSQFSLDNIDTTLCEAKAFHGMYLAGAMETTSALLSIMLQHQLVSQEVDGTIHLFPIELAPQVAIRNETEFTDFGCKPHGSPPTNRVTYGRPTETDLPTSLTIQFQNLDQACAPATEHFGLRAPLYATHVKEDALDYSHASMTRSEARDLLATVMRRTYINAHTLSFTLPPRYLHLLENDLIPFTDLDTGAPKMARIIHIEHGADWIVRVQAVEENVALAVGASGVTGTAGSIPSVLAPATVLATVALDIPPLLDEQAFQPGIQVAASSKDGGAWVGVRVYLSLDGGSEYVLACSLDSEHCVGATMDALADGPASEVGAVVTWDTTNSVTVQLDGLGPDGGLASLTEDQVLAGANWFQIGDEIIGARDVSQSGDKTYVLSHLLRGLRGSLAIAHAIGDRAVLLTDFARTGRFVRLPKSAIGTDVYLKFLQPGQALSAVDPVVVAYEGWNVRPLPVYDGGAAPLTRPADGTNDVSFTPRPRTRLNLPIGAVPPFSFDESFEEFQVRVYSSNTYVTLKQTIIITTIDGTTGKVYATRNPDADYYYTAAEQTADGLTPGATIYFDVAHRGDFGLSRAVRYSG